MNILSLISGWFGKPTKPQKRHIPESNKCACCEAGLIENGRYKGHEVCSECLIDQVRAVRERDGK